MYTLPEADRVPFKFGHKLADYLVAEGPRFRPGDVVLGADGQARAVRFLGEASNF